MWSEPTRELTRSLEQGWRPLVYSGSDQAWFRADANSRSWWRAQREVWWWRNGQPSVDPKKDHLEL